MDKNNYPIQLQVSELQQWRVKAQKKAQAAGVDVSEVDWLLQMVTSLSKLELSLGITLKQTIDSQKTILELEKMWQARVQERVPIQYIVGITPWRDVTLQVLPGVLIPRPETELLIDWAVEAVANGGNPHLAQGIWVDMGTGSGAIAIGLARVFPEAQIYGVDCSVEALEIAQTNIENCGLAERITLKQGSWWSPLEEWQGQISGMISNPPYIPTSSISQLQAEVNEHEPHIALDGGYDGLLHIEYLGKTAHSYLQSGGIWLIEMMIGQSQSVLSILAETQEYKNLQILKDLNGVERFALAYRQ